MSNTAQCFYSRKVVRFRTSIIILLTVALSGCAINSGRPKVPPGFLLKWDVSKTGSSVAQDFEVVEYRVYRIELIFSPHVRPFDNQAFQDMQAFTGDGSLQSDGHGHVSNGTSEKSVGVVIPIHLVIRSMPGSDSHRVPDSVNRQIETKGIEGATSINKDFVVKGTPSLDPLSQGGSMRLIAEAALHPGVYHLEARAERATAVPQNIETLLSVSSIPKTTVLRDND